MFKYKNKEYRNLTEQVSKNEFDILRLLEGDATLAQFGLKVVNLSSTAPIAKPTPIEGDEHVFGYAWLVGSGPSYQMYVWTRTERNLDGEWVNIGQFPMPGPQGAPGATGATGPKGATGPQGVRGSLWSFVQTNLPTSANKGDFCMTSNFDVYVYSGTGWVYVGNPKGPKGDPGQDGRDGATPQIVGGYWYINGQNTGVIAEGKDGSSINIQDGIYTVDTLPNFGITQTNDAYIVRDDAGKYDLYIHAYGGVTWTIVDDWGGVPVPGPQGPEGDTGPQGPEGKPALQCSAVYTNGTPAVDATLTISSTSFNRTALVGDNTLVIWQANSKSWVVTAEVTAVASNVTLKVVNFVETTGLTGPQGPQGATGATGKSIITVEGTPVSINYATLADYGTRQLSPVSNISKFSVGDLALIPYFILDRNNSLGAVLGEVVNVASDSLTVASKSYWCEGAQGPQGPKGADGQSISVFRFGGTENPVTSVVTNRFTNDGLVNTSTGYSSVKCNSADAEQSHGRAAQFTFSKSLVLTTQRTLNVVVAATVCGRAAEVIIFNEKNKRTVIFESPYDKALEFAQKTITLPAGTYNKIQVSASSVSDIDPVNRRNEIGITMMVWYLP